MDVSLTRKALRAVATLALLMAGIAGSVGRSHAETQRPGIVERGGEIRTEVDRIPGEPGGLTNARTPQTAATGIARIVVSRATKEEDRKPQREEHNDHEGEDHEKGRREGGHRGEGHHENEHLVKLSQEEIDEFAIKLEKAGPAAIRPSVALTGEVVFNPDKVVHVLPRVPGIVRHVFKSVGDTVKVGDLLAILDSTELATAKSEYLEALTREELEKANFEREEKLWKDQVSSEKDFLAARQALKEALIRRERADRALHALGLSEDDLSRLPNQEHKDLTRYEMTSPLDGIVVQRHLVRGEVIRGDNGDPPFIVADMSSVWINLAVRQKDLVTIKKGQQAVIAFGKGVPEASGVIDYVTPALDESTRTATARVVLDNQEGQWRPGMFVTGHVGVGEHRVQVWVPKTALLTVDGKQVVFVQTDEGFEPREVKTGREDRIGLEIVSGLTAGEIYVAEKGFVLKAELKKASFAGHGHAH